MTRTAKQNPSQPNQPCPWPVVTQRYNARAKKPLSAMRVFQIGTTAERKMRVALERIAVELGYGERKVR